MFERPSTLLRSFYPDALWRMEGTDKRVALTFDDGPIPIVTPWILDLLKEQDIKATFFMVGDNIRKNSDVYQRVVNEGHKVGNHTYNHLKSFQTSKMRYLDNIEKSQEIHQSNLFRPPYGQLIPWYMRSLKQNFEKVVFWDVLSRDYDRDLTPQQVFENVKNNVRPGSIIVFHDNIKAFDNLKFALPKSIEYLKQLNYQFDTL